MIARSVASSASSGRDEDEHRMMASTTVFVLEPGVTALGDHHEDRVDQDGGVVDDGSSLSGFGNLKVKISSPKFACSLLSHLEILRQSSRACNVLPP